MLSVMSCPSWHTQTILSIYTQRIHSDTAEKETFQSLGRRALLGAPTMEGAVALLLLAAMLLGANAQATISSVNPSIGSAAGGTR